MPVHDSRLSARADHPPQPNCSLFPAFAARRGLAFGTGTQPASRLPVLERCAVPGL